MALPLPLAVPAATLRDPAAGARLEWLEPDGRGGYAAGTAIGANTRRYHGVLVVARRPPTDRVVLLSRLEETVVGPGGERWELGVNFYPDAVHPRGHERLDAFRLDPWPTWRWRLGALTLTKTLFHARAARAVLVAYRIEGGDARLELRPFVAARDFHALVTANDAVATRAVVEPGRVTYRAYPDQPPLVLSHQGGEWRGGGEWYYRTVYPRETDRGLDDREDLWLPGVLHTELRAGATWRIACATRPVDPAEADAWAADERRRREAAAAQGRRAAGAGGGGAGMAAADGHEAGTDARGSAESGGTGAADSNRDLGDLAARLGLAADAFIVERDGGRSILAGYPWFADWGRDAMISLPGLCLATGRLDDAAAVLRAFAAKLWDGLVPNRFPDYAGEVPPDHYNAADASLWFVEAVGGLAEAGGDAGGLWPAVREIVEAYRDGTHFGIRMEADGLVRQGAEHVQLTWMDAKVEGWVVTPRSGRAVEINALWYNALERAAGLAARAGADPAPYAALAARVRAAFEAFWYEEGGYLYDLIDDDGRPDPALRPNQLFALSLPHSPVSPERARRIVEIAVRELHVPLGVRTLACGHPRYIGRFGGGPRERDAAYHCGTAWPWLLGPLAGAYLRAHGGSAEARRVVRGWLEPFRAHMAEQGLGQVAEVVSGDPPHHPGGCFAQAWSCAELLRILALLAGASAGGGGEEAR